MKLERELSFFTDNAGRQTVCGNCHFDGKMQGGPIQRLEADLRRFQNECSTLKDSLSESERRRVDLVSQNESLKTRQSVLKTDFDEMQSKSIALSKCITECNMQKKKVISENKVSF